MRPETAEPDGIVAASEAEAPTVSIVVPVFNESAGLARFDAPLRRATASTDPSR
jgi:hypothetical protein